MASTDVNGGGVAPSTEKDKDPQKEGSAAFLRASRAGNLEKVLEILRMGTDINTCNANGLNALHLASKEGHVEVVRELLKRKASVDAATKKGNTALHIASLAGQSMIVTVLVENGANVNVQSLNGFTPLYMASQENHETVVRYLIDHGANQMLATEDGFTPLAVALQQGHDRVVAILLENDTKGKVRLPALHIAAKKDDVKAATLLLQNEHNPDVTSKSGFTPLHIASHYGNENVAALLLEKGANVNFQARHQISPLHVATKWGRANMVNVLLSSGAVIDARTRDLLTPLHCAARSGHDAVVDLLLEKQAPISAKTKNGLAPLHMAAQGDHVDTARILLYHRAPVDDVTVDYLTPLHVAAHYGHVRTAKLLLDRNADPNARALNGFTPLHIACKKNRIKVVELLLKYRASIEATTESGLSPLHVAAFMGCVNIVIYLLQQGANADVETVRGETPLHLAARANQTDVVRVLLRHGARVDAKAREHQTPLHIASRLGNTDIVVLLIQAGADPNAATKDQYTPLHIAAKEGQEEVAAILLDHNADKALLTKKGFTPLHLASKYGNVEVAKLLLERGTPVDIEGKNQVTPLHVAAHYNNDKVALLLLEHGASAKAAAKNGYTPLHIAAKKNQLDIAATLLQYKADPNARSRAGFTPLHLASQEGHAEMTRLLMQNGGDVAAKANNGLTAMHLCAQEDRVAVAEDLVKGGAEIDSQTNAGYTPLHVACHFGQLNMIRFLIEHGARVGEITRSGFTPLHQAAQQGHNHAVKYLLDNGASANVQDVAGHTPLAIAQKQGYVSVVETLRTVTETTVVTETTTVNEEKYRPQNPEGMNETMFSESEEEADDHHTNAHARDFNDSLTQGLQDSSAVHLIHTNESQLLTRNADMDGAPLGVHHISQKEVLAGIPSAVNTGDSDLEQLIRRAQNQPAMTAKHDASLFESTIPDNVPIGQNVAQPNFLISFVVDARGGAMRGCRHSGVRIIVPPRKAAAPIRVTCRYLRKDKLAHPPPLSEGEDLASRILEMAPAGAKFLGPIILEVPHFASLRDREREIVILRSDDGQHWKEHQLEATEDAVQEVLNESFDAEELSALEDLNTNRITRVLTNDLPMYFAVVTRVRQEVHCVGPEGGVILSSVVPRVQAIFPDGSLTKTIKVSVQAQPVPQDIVSRLHGNRVAVSPIVTVEPRRRKFHKPITLCIPLPQSGNKQMLTQYSGQSGQEPPTLRLLCSITGGSAPAQWEDITGTTQLTFTGDEVSFTTTVSARFWLMDCQTPRDAARMAQEVYNEAISIPYMAKFTVFARRTFPVEGQLRVFCMTDDKEDKTLEKQEHFKEIARSRDVEVLKGKHQFLEFAGNLQPVTKSGEQLSLYFLPFQENRLAFMVKTRNKDDSEAATEGRIAMMREPRIRAESLPPQAPVCTLAITLPEYTGEHRVAPKRETKPFEPLEKRYGTALDAPLPDSIHPNVLKGVGGDWQRLARALDLPHKDISQIRAKYPGQEVHHVLRIWIHLKKEDATNSRLDEALRQIGRDDIVRSIQFNEVSQLHSDSTHSLNGLPSKDLSSLMPSKDYSKVSRKEESTPSRDSSLAEPSLPLHSTLSSQHEVLIEERHSTPVGGASFTSEPSPVRASHTASPEVHESHHHVEPIGEEPVEEEEPEIEVRTVHRTERHIHDTEEGPVVEETTVTTTYENDVPVKEETHKRTDDLTEEEYLKWNTMHREAERVLNSEEGDEVPEGMHREIREEVEEDGTIVRTTVVTSTYAEEREGDQPHHRSVEPVEEENEDEESDADSQKRGAGGEEGQGTKQKVESMEEGETNEDGSVVVSKKMTRVVTTTRTTAPGDEPISDLPSPEEEKLSVREKIARFEQLGDVEGTEGRKSESGSEASTDSRIVYTSSQQFVSPPTHEEHEEDRTQRRSVLELAGEYDKKTGGVVVSREEDEPQLIQEETTEDVHLAEIKSIDHPIPARRVSRDTMNAEQEHFEQRSASPKESVYDEPEDEGRRTSEQFEETTQYHLRQERSVTGQEEESMPTGQESEDEESVAGKLAGFAKTAGKIAGGVVLAPAALVAAGAAAAYDALKKDDEPEHVFESHEEVHHEERRLSSPKDLTHEEEHFEERRPSGDQFSRPESVEERRPSVAEAAVTQAYDDFHQERRPSEHEEPEHVIESHEEFHHEERRLSSPKDLTHEEEHFEERRPSGDQFSRPESVEERRPSATEAAVTESMSEYRDQFIDHSQSQLKPDEYLVREKSLEEEAIENVGRLVMHEEVESDDTIDRHQQRDSSTRDENTWITDDSGHTRGDDIAEYSDRLAKNVVEEASTSVIRPRRTLAHQESCQEVTMEPEVDYSADLAEKLEILASERRPEVPIQRDDDVLESLVEEEEEEEEEEERERENVLEGMALGLVSDVLEGIGMDEDVRSQSTRYYSATDHSASRADTNYDTCVTSQDDTFESAQGWTSQESEYQSAPSGVESRASDIPSRAESVTPQGASTPLAAVSPVASDRQAQAEWDDENDSPLHRRFTDIPDSVRSTPDVILSMGTVEEGEEESLSPPPGQLLVAPSSDPDRPVSPVPPRPGQRLIEDDVPLSREASQAAFTLNVEDEYEMIEREEAVEGEERRTLSETTPMSESFHESAMRSEETPLRPYHRQSSDVSSSSHADTVIPVDESRRETTEREMEMEDRGSADSLDRVSLVSGGSGKRYSTSRKSSTSLKDEEKSDDKLTPEMEERPIVEEAMDEDMDEEDRPEIIESLELETVQEEGEDGESVNESGSSSNGGDTLQRLGKYKHASSDNVSLTSLQEFERLEAKIAGEGSLSGSDMELFTQGARRSMEGSHDSLAEFERLEEEVKKMSPQGEEVMMLSDIREESECEDMSTKGDDEEDVQSTSEMRVRPIDEEERVGTPIASPDSIEGDFDKITDADIAAAEAYMEQSVDSLEMGETHRGRENMEISQEESSLAVHPEGRLVAPTEGALRDSLENVAHSHDKDSLLEGSQEMFTSQDTQAVSGDTFHDDDVDSLTGEMTSAGGYPITLTTFETRRVSPDGSVETLSRRVQTRVTDPVSSHVQFTGTETEDQIKELEQVGVKETRDEEGNVTRTTYSKSHQ